MDKATADGIAAVDRIAAELNLAGVYGPLFSLFTVDDKYKAAVEATAGSSLFHVVVDTDETAAKVVEIMNRDRAGRVTFVPLNRLRSKTVDFPQANDAVLMIKKIQFEARFRLAMEQVFGKTIICPNLEIAGAYVRSHRVDAITLDGDKIERKGALSGGYHDPRRSRIDAARSYQQLKNQVAAATQRSESVRQQITRLEQEVTQSLGQMQNVEARRRQLTESRGPLLDQLTWLRREEESCVERLKHLESMEREQALDLSNSETTRQALEEELQTDMDGGLSAEEQGRLDFLNADSERLAKEIRTVAGEVARVSVS